MKYSIIIVLLFLNIYSVSYTEEREVDNYLTLNFLSLLNPYHQKLDFGYGTRLNKRIGVEYGYSLIFGNDVWSSGDVGRPYNAGNVLKIEPKFILFDKTIENQTDYFFLSLNIYFTDHRYLSTRYKDFNINKLNSSEIESYNVESIVFGIIPQFGFYFFDKDGFYGETSIGIGMRRLVVKNDFEGEIDELSDWYRWNESLQPEKEGVYNKIAISFNFKLGFTF